MCAFLVQKGGTSARGQLCLRCLEDTVKSWVLCPHLCALFLALESGFYLYISQLGELREKLVETGGQKEKEVGGVAIQCCANQAEKSWKGVGAKTSQSQVLPPPRPTQVGLMLMPGKMEAELLGRAAKVVNLGTLQAG